MRNELQEAIEYLENQLELVRRYAEGYPDKDNYTALVDIYTTALDTTLSALRDALQRQPDPDTGLVPCGWCGPERMGWFSVQFWVRASTGKRKWMSVTQQYKKQVNYCPMCGRKLEDEK